LGDRASILQLEGNAAGKPYLGLTYSYGMKPSLLHQESMLMEQHLSVSPEIAFNNFLGWSHTVNTHDGWDAMT